MTDTVATMGMRDSRNTRFAGAFVYLLIVENLLAMLHFTMVGHRVSSEDGAIVHTRADATRTQAPDRFSGANLDYSISSANRQTILGPFEGHDLCFVVLCLQHRRGIEMHGAAIAIAQAREMVVVEREVDEPPPGIDVHLFAPKHSPPA